MLTAEQSPMYKAQMLAYRYWYWAPPVILVAVGLATAAVRVSYTAWLLAAAVLAWLAYGYRLSRAGGGELDAADRLRPHLLVLTLGLALALVLIPPLNAPGRRPAFGDGPVFLWIYVPMITWALWALIARWPWGERWTGPLLVDITPHQPAGPRLHVWSIALLAVISLVGLVIAIVSESRIGAVQLMIAATLIYQVVSLDRMTRRTAVHEQGIVAHGELIRWSRIESYSWRSALEASGAPVAELHLQRRARVHFPHRVIVVAQDRRDQVDEILSRKLST